MHKCPKCSAEIYRVPRRLFDRVLSVLVPMHRYKCSLPYCDWEGNVSVDQKD